MELILNIGGCQLAQRRSFFDFLSLGRQMGCEVAEVKCRLHVQKLLQLLCLVEHQLCCQWALVRRGLQYIGRGLSHKLIRSLKYFFAFVVRFPVPLPLVADALKADTTKTYSATNSTGSITRLTVFIVRLATHI